MGVRYFDIRLDVFNNELYTFHNIVPGGEGFGTILKEVREFLN